MANTEPPSRDPDDWWADLPQTESGAPDEPRSGQPAPYGSSPFGYRLGRQLPLTPRARLLGAVGFGILVLLLLGLLAAGVFTGGGSKKAVTTLPLTTTNGPTTTPTTPTTPKPAVTAPTVPMKPGDTGAQVKDLQRLLASLGYSAGKVDGIFGPNTTAAVESFQEAAGLDKDGIVGLKTLAALQAKVQSAQ